MAQQRDEKVRPPLPRPPQLHEITRTLGLNGAASPRTMLKESTP